MKNKSWLLLVAFSLGLLAGCGGGGVIIDHGPPASQFSVSGPASSGAGFAFNFTVIARDSAGNAATSYSGTVQFTSSDPAAKLPPASTLVNGKGTFSATLTNAGSQTITATDTVSAALNGSLRVTAVAGEFPVTSFGAKGDGQTDDTAAIQSAINAASAAGGGSVVLGVARYFTAGRLMVPEGVVLCGPTEGPFDVTGVDPSITTVAATILITNTSGPFLTLQGVGAGVTDLLFHYPKQVHTSASAPNVYPFTILVTAPGTKVARSTMTNAYDFLDIESGRVIAQDLFIGAFHNDIKIDHANDHVTIRRIMHSIFWDILENVPGFFSPIDVWVLNNGTAVVVGHVDSLEISDLNTLTRSVGILLTDSSDTTQSIRCGYGTGSDIDLEGVVRGIVITASNTPGYKFTNVDFNAQGNIGQAAVQVNAGGSMPPKILVDGGWQSRNWALGPFPPPPVGELVVVNYFP